MTAKLAFASVLLSSLSLGVLTVATPAHADEPAAAPVAPLPVAPIAGAVGCTLGAHAGVDEVDAQTATQIVCNEVSRRMQAGVNSGVLYRFSIGKLGGSLYLSLSSEAPAGVTRDVKTLQVSSIDEVAVAAPRLAEALTQGKSVEQTLKVSNVVAGESRKPKSKGSDAHFSMGLLGVIPPPSLSAAPGPGAEMNLMFESDRIAIGTSLRAAGKSSKEVSVGYFAWSVGGRYHLNDTDISPYVGTGLALTSIKVNDSKDAWSNGGIGAYGEVGVEVMRTHRNRLGLGVRLDLPFYALTSSSRTYISGDTITTAEPRYYIPVTANATFTF